MAAPRSRHVLFFSFFFQLLRDWGNDTYVSSTQTYKMLLPLCEHRAVDLYYSQLGWIWTLCCLWGLFKKALTEMRRPSHPECPVPSQRHLDIKSSKEKAVILLACLHLLLRSVILHCHQNPASSEDQVTWQKSSRPPPPEWKCWSIQPCGLCSYKILNLSDVQSVTAGLPSSSCIN